MSVPTAARAAPAGWASRGACLDSDPDLFFPIAPTGPGLQQIAQAKAVCARCPVRRECLGFAQATHQVHGVWGGTSEEERQLLRSRGPDGRPGHSGAGPGAGSGAPAGDGGEQRADGGVQLGGGQPPLDEPGGRRLTAAKTRREP